MTDFAIALIITTFILAIVYISAELIGNYRIRRTIRRKIKTAKVEVIDMKEWEETDENKH